MTYPKLLQLPAVWVCMCQRVYVRECECSWWCTVCAYVGVWPGVHFPVCVSVSVSGWMCFSVWVCVWMNLCLSVWLCEFSDLLLTLAVLMFSHLDALWIKTIAKPWEGRTEWRNDTTCYETALQGHTIKTAWHCHGNRHTERWSWMESLEINPLFDGQLIFDKWGWNIQWSKENLFNGTGESG